jgi:hypothetical protein
MSHFKRHHPKRRRSPFSYADRHRVAIAKSRACIVSPPELLFEPLADPSMAALLGLSMSPRIIC